MGRDGTYGRTLSRISTVLYLLEGTRVARPTNCCSLEHGCFLLANYRCSNSLLLRVGVLVLVGYDPALETERVQVISEPEEEINICDVARFFNFQSAARLGRLLRPRSPLNSNAGEELRPERPS